MTELPPLNYRVSAAGSRYELNTPSLVLDIDGLERNIARMAAVMRSFGRTLRPHAKSHKCSRIARAQIEAGAVGICCATLDEAEVMASRGIRGILITSPVTTAMKIERLVALVRQAPDTMIVVDNPDNASALARTAKDYAVVLPVLVDIELGFGRTGVLGVDAAERLARHIRDQRALIFSGVQAYGGHLQHTANHVERVELTRRAHAFVAEIVDRLGSIGMPPAVVTGGGTGTHAIDAHSGPFTEIQAGSYVFMDAEYQTITYEEGKDWPFEHTLFVQTAVTSNNVAGTVTTDAGTKSFALNGPKPRVVSPGLVDVIYDYSGDEHGRIRLAEGHRKPRLGERLECVIPHCDPTVVLYDRFHCVRGDALVDIWPIDARGRR
jgi:D-serine deaminase-like pyridoxal phosphate-dependent protein